MGRYGDPPPRVSAKPHSLHKITSVFMWQYTDTLQQSVSGWSKESKNRGEATLTTCHGRGKAMLAPQVPQVSRRGSAEDSPCDHVGRCRVQRVG